MDALVCFIRSDLDCLVLDDTVLDRRDVPATWVETFRDLRPSHPGISGSVYTLL
jgi:carbamoyltransferase